MSNSIFRKRQDSLMDTIPEYDLDALVLNPGPDLAYLTGLSFHLMERPVVAFFLPDQDPIFVLPELETQKLQDLSYPVESFPYQEDRSHWLTAFQSAVVKGELDSSRLGVIPRRMRFLELNFLKQAAPQASFHDGQSVTRSLRIIKDQIEIQAMQRACHIAQRAMQTLRESLNPGITEKQAAAKLVSLMLEEGSEPDFPFFPIVSFGEHSANPHATPQDSALHNNQLVLIDWGATVEGYHSDITRAFHYGDVNEELAHIARIVQEANQVGRRAVRPGIPCSKVDQRVRSVIEDAGYGDAFIHRTGHGLGKEAHEEPFIAADDETRLRPGMSFTIEPGIYLPGTGGVRIEDVVVVTDNGCKSLSNLPRGLESFWLE